MSENLVEVLNSFSRIDKVSGAVLLDPQGGMLANTLKDQVLKDQEGKIFSSFQSGQQLGQILGLGALNHSYLEFSELSFTSEKFKGQETLVIISKTGANLGRIRLEVRKNRRILEELLARDS